MVSDDVTVVAEPVVVVDNEDSAVDVDTVEVDAATVLLVNVE